MDPGSDKELLASPGNFFPGRKRRVLMLRRLRLSTNGQNAAVFISLGLQIASRPLTIRSRKS